MSRFGKWLKEFVLGVDIRVCPKGKVDKGVVRQCYYVKDLPVKCECRQETFRDELALRKETIRVKRRDFGVGGQHEQ